MKSKTQVLVWGEFRHEKKKPNVATIYPDSMHETMDSEISKTAFRICSGEDLDRCEWRDVECDAVPTNYQRFIAAIRSGTPGEPDFARGAEVQRVIDACFESDQKRCSVSI